MRCHSHESNLVGQSTYVQLGLVHILCLIFLSTTAAAQQTFLPELARDDSASLAQNYSETTITWIGHATVLIQIDGVNVLTDPMWSDRSYPILGPKRIVPPGIEIDSLPNIDVVVISHNHFDHLDSYSVEQLWSRNKPLFLVPKGIKKWFDAEDISKAEELNWWDSYRVKGIIFFCVPAAHRGSTIFFSKRDETDLCAGWVICGQKDTIYFAGDTDYFNGFKTIAQRIYPIHIALLPIAPAVGPHLHGQKVIHAFLDLRAHYLVPVHWGTFEQDITPNESAVDRLKDAINKSSIPHDRVLILRHGETIKLPQVIR